MTERLPLLVLTGFLGSGKTTLVQRFLRTNGAGTGVIVNEFGEIGLDQRLVVHAAEHVELFGNGCLCCAQRSDVARALYELVQLSRRGSGGFSRAILETSGLADPAPVIATLARDPWLRNNIRLTGVVTVVDAVSGLRTLERHAEARRQVALADVVLITKMDMRAAADIGDLGRAIGQIAPDVPIFDTQSPHFALAELFTFVGGAAIAGSRPPKRQLPQAEEVTHDGGVGSFTIGLPAVVDWPAFTVWLSALLYRHGEKILRVKGLVRTSSGAGPLVIHGVQHTMHPPVHLTGPDDGEPSFLVFIARELTKDQIAQSLDRFLAWVAADGKSTCVPA